MLLRRIGCGLNAECVDRHGTAIALFALLAEMVVSFHKLLATTQLRTPHTSVQPAADRWLRAVAILLVAAAAVIGVKYYIT